ncbi:MAG: N-acetyl-alpha-D-glucosaminyl L-malate synthase BshA [Puniceicoccaceae bacterium]|nr:MAG: N-acetyl-alpha-D-glucosaminyl L-malate synthase BshA [Puniceicoccaceae bacterium]
MPSGQTTRLSSKTSPPIPKPPVAIDSQKPLRIGIVCYPSIGGSGILATRLGEILAKAGHEVHFISYEKPFHLDLEIPGLFFHPVVINEYSLFKYPDYTLPLSVRIAEVCETHELDILHVHYAVPHATAALLARLMMNGGKRALIVTTLHGTDTNLIGQDPHYRPIIKYSIDHSDGVTTVSHSLKQQTLETFTVKPPIEVIPNFHDPKPARRQPEAVRRALGLRDGETLALHMSNLRPVKRVGDILQALAHSKHKDSLRLLILAGGPTEAFEKQVRELGLEERVSIRTDVEEVADYIEACDFGVYASEQESFGLSILETLSHGKTVVATRTGGIPEVVHDGETGFLVPVADPQALASVIDRLIEDPELRQRAGAAARRDVQARFGGAQIRDQYVSFYRKLLEQRG